MKRLWKRKSPEVKDPSQPFQQRRGACRTIFHFGNDKLVYWIDNPGATTCMNIDYDEMDPRTDVFVQKNVWFRYSGIVTLALGFFLSLSAVSNQSYVPSPLLILGAALFAAYFLLQVRFTVFHVNRGRMLVIQDKQHQAILDELEKRRVAALRSKYLTFDHTNEPSIELKKYHWLRRMNAITDLELQQFQSVLDGEVDVPRLQPPTISLN